MLGLFEHSTGPVLEDFLEDAPLDAAAAKVFLAVQQVCLKSSDSSLHPLGKTSLVPRAVLHTLVAPH